MNLKPALIIAGGLLFAGAANAQLTIGAKLGGTYSSYNTKIDPEPSEKPDPSNGMGFHLGGFLNYNFSDKIGFRTELLYDSRGQKATSESVSSSSILGSTVKTTTTTESKGHLAYLELPLLLNFQASEALSFQAGPGLGFLLGAKSTADVTTKTETTTGGSTTSTTVTSSTSSTSKEGLRGMELGLCVGGNFQLESGLGFGLRYWRGLSTLNDKTDVGNVTVKTHANVIQLSVNYAFIKD